MKGGLKMIGRFEKMSTIFFKIKYVIGLYSINKGALYNQNIGIIW